MQILARMVLTQVFSVGSARDPEKGGVGEGINGMPPCISIVQSYQYSLQYTQKRKMGSTPYTQKRKLKKKIRSDRSKDTIN